MNAIIALTETGSSPAFFPETPTSAPSYSCQKENEGRMKISNSFEMRLPIHTGSVQMHIHTATPAARLTI
jgi:hypothetical protein